MTKIKVLLEHGEFLMAGPFPGLHWIDHGRSVLRYESGKDIVIDATRPNVTTLILFPDFLDITSACDADVYRCRSVHIRVNEDTKQLWAFMQKQPVSVLTVHDTQGFLYKSVFQGDQSVLDYSGGFDLGDPFEISYAGYKADRRQFMSEVEAMFRTVKIATAKIKKSSARLEMRIIQY